MTCCAAAPRARAPSDNAGPTKNPVHRQPGGGAVRVFQRLQARFIKRIERNIRLIEWLPQQEAFPFNRRVVDETSDRIPVRPTPERKDGPGRPGAVTSTPSLGPHGGLIGRHDPPSGDRPRRSKHVPPSQVGRARQRLAGRGVRRVIRHEQPILLPGNRPVADAFTGMRQQELRVGQERITGGCGDERLRACDGGGVVSAVERSLGVRQERS